MVSMKKIFSGILLSATAFSLATATALATTTTSGTGDTSAVTSGTGDTSGSTTISLPNPLSGADTFSGLLEKIVGWLITIGTPIATLMVIVGAFQMLFAQGDPKRFETGKKTILYTVIGYGIILIGWGFTTIIQDVLSL
jgi:hypothetical protein